jgi:hypothetical protein
MAPPKPSGKGAKKAVKSVKSAKTGDKKRRKTRKESYSVCYPKQFNFIMKIPPKGVHLPSAEAGPPRHRNFVQSDEHHELVNSN